MNPQSLVNSRLGALIVCLFACSMASTRAAIPTAATQDPRYSFGHLVATHYGADPSGVNDSTTAIQNALNDGKANHLAVFLEAGTYKVSNTLYCYNYQLWDPNTGAPKVPEGRACSLVGSKKNGSRPVLKLAPNANGFGSTSSIKAVLVFRNFRALNSQATSVVHPANPMAGPPPNFANVEPNLFDYEVRNVDFDLSGNAGAVGLSLDGAQNCNVNNVRVVATGAYAGIVGLPGVGGVSNIEVEGGKYGLAEGAIGGGSETLSTDVLTIAGLKLINQTDASLLADSFSGPVQAVGFYIKPGPGAVAVKSSTGTPGSSFPTTRGTYLLLDGEIDMSENSGAIAIDNDASGRSINVRNVYVKGTNNLVKSGGRPTITASGSAPWKRIVQYTYTDQHPPTNDPIVNGSTPYTRTYSLLLPGGSLSTTQEPVVIKEDAPNPSTPPADLLSRHVWADLPSFEDGVITNTQYNIGSFENPLTYGATREELGSSTDTGGEDSTAFEAAIAAASVAGSAAQGRVIVPRGIFHLVRTLTLNGNTKFFGAGLNTSRITVHDSWTETTGSPFVVQTVDDASATTFLGFLTLEVPRDHGTVDGTGLHSGDRFSHLLWRAGRFSGTMAWVESQQWMTPGTPAHPKTLLKLAGNGGGRHYGFSSPGRGTGGLGYRALVFQATHEPTWFYTCNVEVTKDTGGVTSQMNIEMNGASNVRLLGMKREGSSPTVIMTDSTNIALFGHENRVGCAGTGDIQIAGTSNHIMIQGASLRGVAGSPGKKLVHDSVGATVTIDYGYSVSIFQRGTPDDSAVYISPAGNPLPSPWVTTDVGPVNPPGSATHDSGTGTFTVSGSGADIYGSTDAFRFVYQAWTGDATLIARVPTIQPVNNYAKAGVMIRKSLAANSAHALINVTPAPTANGLEFLRRTADGNATTDATSAPGTGMTAPKWLKLVRTGDSFTAYYSDTGTSWTQLGSAVTIPMGTGTVYVGLAVCSHTASSLNTSTFTNVSVAGVPNSVPNITTAALPGTIAGEAYSQTVAATGGDGALVWSLASGALPAGLSLSGGGVISGTSTTAGTANFTVKVADSDGITGAGDEDTQALSIVVGANSTPSITTTTLANGMVGAGYSQGLAATGGNGALVWSVASGSLPAGLNLSAGGVISGTPTQGGIASFTVKVADSDGIAGAGDEDTQALTLSITVGPFVSEDIGSPGLAGSASLGGGVYTVTGGGADIYGTADQFRFIHQGWSGDGRIIARVTAVENTHSYAKAGVMMRDDLTTGSRHVMHTLLATAGIQLLHRATAGGTTTSDALVSGFSAPYWLRLERHGNTFTGWQSPDGAAWYLTGATTFTLNNSTRVGLAVTAHNNADLNTSTFENVSVGIVPAWTAADIGSVGTAGSTSVNYTTDVFTLNGAGANIYNTTDSFHFNYLTWTDDATLIAEVTALENTSSYAKGGLMIRQSTASNAVHATVALTPGNGVEFLRRTTPGGTTTNTNTAGITAPRWIKLVRSGSSFSAYYSSDGGTWTQVGSTQPISMTGTVYVGLVSCSFINTTNLCTVTFESVYIK